MPALQGLNIGSVEFWGFLRERERENFCMCVAGREREGRKEGNIPITAET